MEWLAGIAVGPGDHVDLVHTAVTVCVRSEKLAEDSSRSWRQTCGRLAGDTREGMAITLLEVMML